MISSDDEPVENSSSVGDGGRQAARASEATAVHFLPAPALGASVSHSGGPPDDGDPPDDDHGDGPPDDDDAPISFPCQWCDRYIDFRDLAEHAITCSARPAADTASESSEASQAPPLHAGLADIQPAVDPGPRGTPSVDSDAHDFATRATEVWPSPEVLGEVVTLDPHDTASDDSGTQTVPPVAIAPLVAPVSYAIDQNAKPPRGRLSHASSSTPSTVNHSTSAVQALLLLAQGPVPDLSDVSQDTGSTESGSRTNQSADWGHRAEAIQLYQDHQGGSYLAYPTQGMTPAPAREHRMSPVASRVPATQLSPLVAPVADPARDAIPSSQLPLRQQPSDPDLAYHLAMQLRQEVAEKKAAAAAERYGELAQDVRQANTAAASTATLVQSMMDRLDSNHLDSIDRVTDLAAMTSTSQDRDMER